MSPSDYAAYITDPLEGRCSNVDFSLTARSLKFSLCYDIMDIGNALRIV